MEYAQALSFLGVAMVCIEIYDLNDENYSYFLGIRENWPTFSIFYVVEKENRNIYTKESLCLGNH